MPELPEVETMVRGVRPHAEGRRIEAFALCPCDYRPIAVAPPAAEIAPLVRGRTVSAVRRFAKRVVLDLDDGSAFAVEPRMTGLMLVADPPDATHLRAEWRFDVGRVLFWDRRGLGTVTYYVPHAIGPALSARFGPDAMDMTAARWRERLARTARPVKVAMLDQSLVAGIGNMYASEILHRAAVHPAAPARSVGPRRCARIDAACREVLTEAIKSEGSTLSDGTYRNALNQDGSYQNAHRVYDRAGQPCPRCGTAVRRVVQSQRSTFFCPGCQRK